MTVPSDWLTPEEKKQFFEQCNSETCQNAVSRLTNARNAFPHICNDIQSWKDLRGMYILVSGSLFSAAAILAGIAATTAITIVGIPLAVAAFYAAVVVTIIALFMAGLAANAAIQYGLAQGALTAAQGEFTAALTDARQKCGPYCNIGDTNMPICKSA
jgi:hypothetical protein